MVELYVRKTQSSLVGASPDDQEEIGKIDDGRVVLVVLKGSLKTTKHVRLLATSRELYEQHAGETCPNFETFKDWLKIAIGWTRMLVRPSGEVMHVPKSWKRTDMSNKDCDWCWHRVMDYAEYKWGDVQSRAELERSTERRMHSGEW